VITTIVLIRVEPSLIPTAANMLAGVEGVAEVFSVSGEWDLVAIVRVQQYDEIARVVTEVFPTVPGIQRTQTLTAFRAYSKKDLQQADITPRLNTALKAFRDVFQSSAK
jgi:DNA-binding Lrp family transcriptional regulator